MKKRIVVYFVFAIVALLLLTACSSKPEYVSDSRISEIVKYNFGNTYNFVKKIDYPDPYDEKVTIYEYIYKNDTGDSFSVYSTASKMGEPFSGFYSTYVYDDYVAKRIENHKSEIERIFNLNGFDYEIKKDTLSFEITNFKDIQKIGKAIFEVKELLKLEETGIPNNEKYVVKNTFNVSINLKTNGVECYSYRTIEKDDTEDFIKHGLEDLMIDKAVNLKIVDKIGATAEALNNFHIRNAEYHIEGYRTITFYYSEDLNEYCTSDLSICLNYDKYDYNHNDNMQNLIESKGGTFSRNGWKNTWTLNGNTWEAEMIVNSKNEFQDLIVKKNGVNLDLKLNTNNHNSIFQQYLTRDSLEKMLGLTIKINNDGTVDIY